MRFKLSLAVIGLLLAGTAPTLAQNTQTQQGGYGYSAAPVYNTGTGTAYYVPQNNGTAPVYNNGSNVPLLPMQQMIAGKNAPSYSYGNQPQPYNNFGTPATNGYAATPMNQIQGGALPRDMSAFQPVQGFVPVMPGYQQQQQLQNNGASMYQGNAFSQLYANATGQQEKPVPTKKRVIYRQLNNPLTEPPRLFSLDE